MKRLGLLLLVVVLGCGCTSGGTPRASAQSVDLAHPPINAIDVGSTESIRWMLSRGVELSFRDAEGYTPILSALERQHEDRLEVLKLLLQAGAPVNLKGFNDWTPAHMAAARDDVDALRVLVPHGADLSIRTEIDDYATPLEEARNLGKLNAVRFLEGAV